MKKSTYTAIGAFAIGAIALAAVGVALMRGGRQSGDREALFETYLEETVQGVSEGSAVKYRGIPVGSVRRIEFAMLRYGEETPRDTPEQRRARRYARIVFAIDTSNFPERKRFLEIMRRQVAHGLHVYVKSQGITGLSYLDMDYNDGLLADLPVPWRPEHEYIPSAPSLVKTLSAAVQGLVQEFQGLTDTKESADAFLVEATALAGDARAALSSVSGPAAEALENLVRASAGLSALVEELVADPARILHLRERDALQ